MNDIWIEKHRPKIFDEVVGQELIVNRVKAMTEQKNIPHMLFTGPPGTGKTTVALIIAKTLFKENWRQNFLETNASVTGDTPILIKQNGNIKRTNFDEISKEYFKNELIRKRVNTKNLEVLSLKKGYKVNFSKVNYIFRHKVGNIVKIIYEGGAVKTSLNHSIIVFDKNGNLKPKQAKNLQKGDLLISFKTNLNGFKKELDLTTFRPIRFNKLKSGLIKNPKVKLDIKSLELNKNLAWVFGLYGAEGCTSLNKKDTNGGIIYILGYPQEVEMGKNVCKVFNNYGINPSYNLGKSGFNRNNESSIQYRIWNTQLTKFFRENFYNKGVDAKNARNKRVPNFIFEAPIELRKSYLKGYFDGDGHGKWNDWGGISSTSKEGLIDLTWLSRISRIEASHFKSNINLIWKNDRFNYIKSELLPSNLFIDLAKRFGKTYLFRHALYGKKSQRIRKRAVIKFLNALSNEDRLIKKLKLITNSDLSVLKIKDISIEDYNDYVYDFSVPESQMFWGGTNPVLLHNSSERGIDVVRESIKDFARTRPIGDDIPKIILLDEADALTRDAQNALRRTMEQYSENCRFILSANYSSKIIEPIQSRCAIFRFKPLMLEDIKKVVKKIAKEEKLKINDDVIELIYNVSEGDLRRVENILQSCATISNEINENLVNEISLTANPKEIKEIIELALNKEFLKSRTKLLDLMLKNGFSGLDIIKQIQKEILNLKVEDNKKLELIDKCGEIEFRLVEGSDDFVQLESFLAFMGR